MGCDLNWYASQKDIIQQKKASLFVHALLDILKGKIGDLPFSDIEVYNGNYEGFFLNYDTLFLKIIVKHFEEDPDSIIVRHTYETDWENFKPDYVDSKTKLDLIGFTAHFWGKPNAVSDAKSGYSGEVADNQFSFVFNNTPNLPIDQQNQLIAIEQITDFKWRRYEDIYKHFKDTPRNPENDNYAVYQKGGHVRNCSNSILLILYFVKYLFVSDLKVSDDYNEFQRFEKEMKINGYTSELLNYDKRWITVEMMVTELLGRQFKIQNVRPELKKMWEVDFD